MDKNLWKPVLVLSGITCTMAFVLGGVQQLTKEDIEVIKNKQELEAISLVVGDFDNDPFAEQMLISTPDKKDKFKMYPARLNGKLNAVAIKSYTNAGFGGKIEVITGFNVDGSINTFKIVSSSETPGLGTKTDEPRFKEQLRGFHPQKQVLKVVQDGGEVDAVTAATISSRAVLKAIERAWSAFYNFNSRNNND